MTNLETLLMRHEEADETKNIKHGTKSVISQSILINENAKLREIIRVQDEALKYVMRVTYGTELCNTDEENNEILARHFFNSADKAREAQQKVEAIAGE